MTDPSDPLAHLYADFVDEEDDVELPVVPTSIEELIAAAPEPEELTDDDLDELALLVRARIEGPGLPDEEAAALGLGEIVETEPAYYIGPGGSKNRVPIPERELVLNDVGRAVLKRLADRMTAEEFADRLRALGVIL